MLNVSMKTRGKGVVPMGMWKSINFFCFKTATSVKEWSQKIFYFFFNKDLEFPSLNCDINNEGVCDGALIALIHFFAHQPDADFTSSDCGVNAHRGISCLAARGTSATASMPTLGLLCRIYNYWREERQEWIQRVGLAVHNASCDAPKHPYATPFKRQQCLQVSARLSWMKVANLSVCWYY